MIELWLIGLLLLGVEDDVAIARIELAISLLGPFDHLELLNSPYLEKK